MNNTDIVRASLARRYAREKRFRAYGFMAISTGFIFLLILLTNIFLNALPAFTKTSIALHIDFSAKKLGLGESPSVEEIRKANFAKLVKESLYQEFPEVTDRRQKRALRNFVSGAASYEVRDVLLDNPSMLNTRQTIWVTADDDINVLVKTPQMRELPEKDRRFKDYEISWVDKLTKDERVKTGFNTTFFTSGDSREPEQAGIKGALVGSALTMLITLLLSLPLGVAAAIYLEEFAPKNNRWIDIIEININNLAAVPSVIFGLLGLAVFINLFDVPRSAPLVGGLVLTLMTLPTIIISSRAALKSVPPSIREAALGVGASEMQSVFGHVLPLATPGILTGAIIGMAQALGETAPLLMIGMVAFVVDVPGGILEPATVLPVQIYLWSDSPERSFVALTSAAIAVLLLFLAAMNILAVVLRKKFERKW